MVTFVKPNMNGATLVPIGLVKGPRSLAIGMVVLTVALALGLAACGRPKDSGIPGAATLSAAQACRAVVDEKPSDFFTQVEQVDLVMSTYAKGEPVESDGDISHGMPPTTPVWVVEVHAKAINWNHSAPFGYKPPKEPDNDYSVVMNATTGGVTDSGECRCWPRPLHELGTVVSMSADC